MSSQNFPFPDRDKNSFTNYLDALAATNSKVKNKQFHATISTKGREHSFQELQNIAERYLEHMGYSGNPYLIYAHRDSPNNHVHVVSSRIDAFAKKIPDSLERIRTQQFIEKDLKINFSKNIDDQLKDVLEYKFKSEKVFSALLKKQGYKTRDKEGSIEIIKGGRVQKKFSKRNLRTKLYMDKHDFDDKNRIKAQLYKFSTGTDFEILKESMRKNFGIEIIYDYKNKQSDQNMVRNSKEVSGYVLVDHNNKTAYDGSELVGLSNLREKFDLYISNEELSKEIYAIRASPGTYYEAKDFFKDINLNLNYKGELTNPEGNLRMTMDKDIMEALKYNQRVADANGSLHSKNIQEESLAKLFRVDIKDIRLNPTEISESQKDKYREMVISNLERNKDSPKNEKGFSVYQSVNGPIFVDSKKAIILNIEKDLDIQVEHKKEINIPILERGKQDSEYPSKHEGASRDLLPNIDAIYDNEPEQKKRRKRNREQNIQ